MPPFRIGSLPYWYEGKREYKVTLRRGQFRLERDISPGVRKVDAKARARNRARRKHR